MTGGRLRPVVAALLGVYLLCLTFILLVPWGQVPTRGVSEVVLFARHLGVPEVLLLPTRAEFAANAAIVVPAVAAASWLRPRVRWSGWTAYAFLASLSVEAVQALLLPGRSATFVDVVANTTGAVAGGLLGAAYHRVHARRVADSDSRS